MQNMALIDDDVDEPDNEEQGALMENMTLIDHDVDDPDNEEQ